MIKTEKPILVIKKRLSGLAKKLSFIIPVIIALALIGVLSEIYARQAGSDQSQDTPTPPAIAASGKADGPATENATTGEKKKDDFARAPGLPIPLKAAANTEEKKQDEQQLTEREKIFLDRFEQMEKRLAEVEARLADITSVDKCQRAGALTANALQTAAPPASNTTAAAPISDVGENSQAPAKHGGVGISPRFNANSIPRWKNKKEPFAFADFNWLTGAFRTKVEAQSQPGSKVADKEATAVFMRMNSHRSHRGHRGHNDFSVFSVTSVANSLHTFENWYKNIDKTDRVDDLDNAQSKQSKKTGQSNKTNKGTAPASAGK